MRMRDMSILYVSDSILYDKPLCIKFGLDNMGYSGVTVYRQTSA
jgi:hypothetical protein